MQDSPRPRQRQRADQSPIGSQDHSPIQRGGGDRGDIALGRSNYNTRTWVNTW
jgi:hypothetical protein